MLQIDPLALEMARLGHETAIEQVIESFEPYIRGWASKEVFTFFGSGLDTDDLANLMREQVWRAIQKLGRGGHKATMKNFIHLAQYLMKGALWARRNKIYRKKRMPMVDGKPVPPAMLHEAADRIFKALQVHLDFDFEIYLGQLEERLVIEKDSRLVKFLKLLRSGYGFEFIAGQFKMSVEEVKQFGKETLLPISQQFMLEGRS